METDPPTPRPASARDRLLLFVGSLAYVGFVPVASGTVAVAVVGIPLYLLLMWAIPQYFAQSHTAIYIAFCAALTLFSVWIAGHADRILNEKDSSRSVIDEIPGFLIALIGLPVSWKIITAAFFLERAIDIAKIWPASWVERRWPGGWGVVFDDVVAGLYTLAILHAAVRWGPAWLT